MIGEEKINGPNYKKYLLKKTVLEIFYREGHQTIADLCEATNNSIPTITNLMNELTVEGWVSNFGIGQSKGGRKPILYGINADYGYIFGIDLSRQFTRFCIFNLHNQQVGDLVEINQGLDTTDDILLVIKDEVNKKLKENRIKTEKILGYGIAIPGLIDIKKDVSYSYRQFGEKPLRETFTQLLGRPAFIEHDTKIMVLGELWFGLAKNFSNVLFINIGSGIGLSMILNGELYHGHSGFSGEFGHIQMDTDGELCYCGKIGCLETIASGTALVKRAQKKIIEGKNTIISKLANNKPGEINQRTIIEAAHLGDQFAIELLEEAGEVLAKGISILIHLFNPEAIIIGGQMAEAENLIKDPIYQKLSKYTMLRLKQDTQILVSELKKRARLMGTLPVVMSKVLDFDHD
jgi:glucokinase-like ROK family protein